ncbi:hypothetical protein IFT68_23210 [Oxalobacteraceae sp. CFBP 13730]|nr:hypothetical protein [Oxalobacteraceae sp. CFBP 13730]
MVGPDCLPSVTKRISRISGAILQEHQLADVAKLATGDSVRRKLWQVNVVNFAHPTILGPIEIRPMSAAGLKRDSWFFHVVDKRQDFSSTALYLLEPDGLFLSA